MRLTPAQIGVRLICGDKLPPPIEQEFAGRASLLARLQRGRDWLAQITGEDFGYDLLAWHEYLKVSRKGGYTWGQNIVLPRIMKQALASAAWRDAVTELQSKEAG
jgi:hypothetical protein